MADSLFGEGKVVHQSVTKKMINGEFEIIEEGPIICLPDFSIPSGSAHSWEDFDYKPSLKAGEMLWLDDPYADAAQRIEEAKRDLVSTAMTVVAAVGSSIGITENISYAHQVDVPKPTERRTGVFGGKLGTDGLASFPVPHGGIWEQMTCTLFRNGVQWEVRGGVERYSYSEFGLADGRCKSRKNKSGTQDSTQPNRLYWFISAIARSPGCLLEWREKSSVKSHHASENEDESDGSASHVVMNNFGSHVPRKLNGPAARRDLCKRLKLMTRIERDPFLNYRKVGGYKLRLKLVDKRHVLLPGPVKPEMAAETSQIACSRSKGAPASQDDELKKLMAEQAQDRRDDQFRDLDPRLVNRPTKREDY